MTEKIYIRADANKKIGTGHMMRCLSIADKLCKSDCEVIFIVADEISALFLNDKGYEVICLHTIWDNLDTEIEALENVISTRRINKLLIDDYFVTEEYLIRINSITQVYYIDDLNSFVYPVHAVINYNIYAEDIHGYKEYPLRNLNTKFFLGTKYIPLREEFLKLKSRKYNGVKKILITSGGTDNCNMIGNILDYLCQNNEIQRYEWYCIMGKFNENRNNILDKYKHHSNINILCDISNMSQYMEECDVCITAGGTTVYELCACGTPSIVYIIADNQLKCAKKLSEIGLMPCVGDARKDMKGCLDNIIFEIKKYENKVRWENVSNRMQSYVDGNGSERIAELLINE